MMRLSEAVEIAHERVYFRMGEMSAGMREAIARALCLRLETFAVRDPQPFGLAVRRADFARLVDWLVALSLFRTPLAM